jgi:hypothetical protein
MMGHPTNLDEAIRICVEECGARPTDFETLRHAFSDGETWNEYRFIGQLGFGGKLWQEHGKYRVSCYPEDETPERLAMLKAANARLRGI